VTAAVDPQLCPNCRCRCTDEQRALADQVRARHKQAVHRANWTQPLPAPPPRTRWVLSRGEPAHLIGTNGESLCGEVTVELGSRPASDGVRWCQDCAGAAEAGQ
jgi:hypothetical protein